MCKSMSVLSSSGFAPYFGLQSKLQTSMSSVSLLYSSALCTPGQHFIMFPSQWCLQYLAPWAIRQCFQAYDVLAFSSCQWYRQFRDGEMGRTYGAKQYYYSDCSMRSGYVGNWGSSARTCKWGPRCFDQEFWWRGDWGDLGDWGIAKESMEVTEVT